MAISADGWLDWAIRLPGPLAHTNPGVNPVRGIFMHSAEGYASVLLDPNSQYGYNGNHSWHLSNLFDGKLYQHYPLTAKCWHATAANEAYIGVENEGYTPNEPTLTQAQQDTAVRFIKEISTWRGWTPKRPTSPTDTSHTLWEHNEVVRIGGTSSSCPSGRIPWQNILEALNGVDPMDPVKEDALDRRNALIALLAVMTGEGASIGIRPVAPDDYSAVVLQHRDGREWGPIPIDNLPSYFNGAPWL